MAKNFLLAVLICILYSCTRNPNKDIPVITPEVPVLVDTVTYIPRILKDSLTLQDIYNSQVGVRELTGRNDGKEVEMYLWSTHQTVGASWCASFVHWCLDSAKIKNTITAWSPTAHNSKNIIWFGTVFKKDPQVGDVFTLYSPALRRIHHTGFFDKRINETVYQTVEGNTNSGGSVNGDGVYRRKRSFNATYSITRWQKN